MPYYCKALLFDDCILLVRKLYFIFLRGFLLEISIPMIKAKEKMLVSRCDRNKICIGFA